VPEVGEQWDEEDGLEIIYEVAASRRFTRCYTPEESQALHH
jgi:hypothetical protein